MIPTGNRTEHQQYPTSHGYTHTIRSSNRTTIYNNNSGIPWPGRHEVACPSWPGRASNHIFFLLSLLFHDAVLETAGVQRFDRSAVRDNVAWRDVMLMSCPIPARGRIKRPFVSYITAWMPKMLDRAKDRLKKRRVWGYLCVVQQQNRSKVSLCSLTGSMLALGQPMVV